MKFCVSCSNMLHPTADKDQKKLKFVCNFCKHTELVEENTEELNTVQTNEIKLSQFRKKIDPNIVHDPTYSRTKAIMCPECGNEEAIHFHDFSQESSGMLLVFVCCNESCGYSWEEK